MRKLRPVLLVLTLMASPLQTFAGAPGAPDTPLDTWISQDADSGSEAVPLQEDFAPPPPITPASATTDYELSNWQQPQPTEFFTLGELQEEMKKLAWTKGDARIVPYVFLWGTVAYDSSRTFPGGYTLWVPSAADEGEGQFNIDARRTRVGLTMTGPQIPTFDCAQLGGNVEIDFEGATALENKGAVLLRHAYIDVKNKEFRLLLGETWDVMSPLYPSTLMYTVGWSGGNIGYRRAQLRYERFLSLSDNYKLALQGAIAQDVVSDGAAAGQREASEWPVLEGRVGLTALPTTCDSGPITVGLSGHIGDQGGDFGTGELDDIRVRTWSVNIDVNAPITSTFGVKGEFFTGKNLGTFLGGIVQGIDTTRRDGIHATGGWVDVWYDFQPQWHSHLGFGIDDPKDSDLTTSTRQRSYNRFIFTNVSYDVTKAMNLGVELSWWKTKYTGVQTGRSFRVEFVGLYKF